MASRLRSIDPMAGDARPARRSRVDVDGGAGQSGDRWLGSQTSLSSGRGRAMGGWRLFPKRLRPSRVAGRGSAVDGHDLFVVAAPGVWSRSVVEPGQTNSRIDRRQLALE